MILEGIFSRGMEAMTGGIILAGFALALGANDLVLGIIAAIPFLAQLAHIPALAVLSRSPDRRPLTARGALAARTVFLGIALVPFLGPVVDPIFALLGLLLAYAMLSTLSAAAWQVWIRELVPRDRLGSYFGRRMGILSAVGLVTLLAAGQFVSFWRATFPDRATQAFSVLFVLGGILGFGSTYLLSRAPSLPTPQQNPLPLVEALRRPFRERNYRRLLLFLASWGFAANFALPFITVILLRVLGFSFATVTVLAAVSQLANILGFYFWAPFTDHFGHKPILLLSASTFLLTLVMWAFLPDAQTPFLLPALVIVHAFLGLATAGLDLGSNGLVMTLSSEEEAPAFLASASIVKAIATGVAPLVGGLSAALLAPATFSMDLAFVYRDADVGITAIRLVHYDFLFLISALIGIYALHRVAAFEEPGEAHPHVVVRAMRREVSQVSSVAGMRQFAHVASYLVETAYRFEQTFGRTLTRGLPGSRRGRGKAG